MVESGRLSRVQRLFERGGVRFPAFANRPFSIADGNHAFLVESGTIDLFAVRLRDGEPIGTRHHLLTAGPGSCLFGAELPSGTSDIVFLGVGGPGTHVTQLPREVLVDCQSNEKKAQLIAELIDEWVQRLTEALTTRVPPQRFSTIEPGVELSLDQGAMLRANRGVVWVGERDGSFRVGVCDDLVARPSDKAFPLVDPIWLEVTKPGSLNGESTSAMLANGRVWPALDMFLNLSHDIVGVAIRASSGSERERLKRRSNANRQAMRYALSNLSSTMEDENADTHTIDRTDNRLLRACKLVGREAGIHISEAAGGKTAGTADDLLQSIARASRVRLRRVALRGKWWLKDNGPLLGFEEASGVPVALLPRRDHRYESVDSEILTRSRVTAEIAESLASFAYMFYRPFPDQALKAWELFKFGLRASPVRDIYTMLSMGIAVGLLALFTPIATGIIFDTIIPGAERQLLLQITLALIVMAIGTGMFQLTRGLAVLRMESKMGSSVQAGVWDRLLKLPIPFFRQYLAGDLANRSLGIDTIRRLLTGATISSLLGGLFSIFSFALLFYYSARLALVAAGLVFVAAAVTVAASIREVRIERALLEVSGRIQGLVLQIVTGIAKLRVAGAEPRAFAVWAKEFAEQKRLAFRARRVESGLLVFNSAFAVVASMCIFAALASMMANADSIGGAPLSTGSFLAFNAAFGQFMAAALQVNSVIVSLLLIVPTYERAKPILEATPEVDSEKTDPGELSGGIEINHVSFRYNDDSPLVLKDVSLAISPGEFVAVVGPSGAGKSSLVRLLLGFETPENGAVQYDGQDLRSLDVQAVRRQTGVVLQNAQVLPGSIFENIVGATPLSLEDATEAARMAGLAEDIESMPMGMHTFITEGGNTLSGGQRQRILIARAVVARPRILLFDEATSALDNCTQAHVSASLEGLQATRIVIAHRLSTIVNADRIFVIDHGRIVQCGTYEELINMPGQFADLSKRQMT